VDQWQLTKLRVRDDRCVTCGGAASALWLNKTLMTAVSCEEVKIRSNSY
jgi:hypothetical protein